MKDHTTYYDVSKDDNFIGGRQGGLIVVSTYREIPKDAKILCYEREYNILQRTTQYDKQTGKYLNVYIAEDIYG